MATLEITEVTVKTDVKVPVEKAWLIWTTPEHIVCWNHASDDWHTLKAENEVRTGGKFSYRMEAKDGSYGFDFHGVYDEIKPNERLMFTMGDGRKATVTFKAHDNETTVTETFDAEKTNSIDLQKNGWQAILDNFKKYAETQ